MTLTCDDVRDLAAGFVLGALSPEEDAAVRAHLETCADAHAELAELGGVVPYLADALEPVEPPVELRARLLTAAAASPRVATSAAFETGAARAVAAEPVPADASDRAPVAPPAPAPAPIAFPTAAERASRAERAAASRAGAGTWLVRIAAVLAIAVLGAWNLQLQSRLGDVETDLTAAKAYQEAVATVIAIGAQPGAQTAFLTAGAAGTSASGVAAVAPDGTLVLTMRGLQPTQGGQVYEAWVIVGDAAPVPIGGFEVGAAGTGTLNGSTELAQPGAIVALTLEPAPNATTPTLPVLSLGSLATSNG